MRATPHPMLPSIQRQTFEAEKATVPMYVGVGGGVILLIIIIILLILFL